MKKGKHQRVLARIKNRFPQVEEVKDATDSIEVLVTNRDSSSARKKDPNSCALAKACLREEHADGAIIGIAYSWIIKGKTATRYKTSIGVSREITSFDRHQDFQPGKYLLSPISPGNKLGEDTRRRDGKNKKGAGLIKNNKKHFTKGIRIVER